MSDESDRNYILIYGAHLIAIECYRYLCNIGMKSKILGFAVSDMKDNPLEIDGNRVRLIEEYKNYANDTCIFVAIPAKFHREVESNARRLGFNCFKAVSLEQMSEQKGEWLRDKYNNILPFVLKQSKNDPTWLDIYAEGEEGSVRCKYPTLFYLDDKEMTVLSDRMYDEYSHVLNTICELDLPLQGGYNGSRSVEELFGIYMIFGEREIGFVKKNVFDPWIRPLQVGVSGASEIYGIYSDDVGEENLSDKNSYFAEMTGAYWIWKHAPFSEYKGLCHYRRHFCLTDRDVENIIDKDIDVILTTPRYVPGGIEGMFLAETPVKESVMQNMDMAMEKYAEADVEEFKRYLKSDFYFPNNMVIAKGEIYDSYCEWIFPILANMYKRDIYTGYGHENDRHIAYAAELLTSYYFIKRKKRYKIVYTDYRFLQ